MEVRDVGWGGLHFLSSELLPVDCPLNLRLQEDRTGAFLFALGRVAWSGTVAPDGRDVHRIGVEFEEFMTPATTCAAFLETPALVEPVSAPIPNRPRRRNGARYALDGAVVTVRRIEGLRWFRRSRNIAAGLIDFGRTGAQVVCRDSLKPGERVRLKVQVATFQDAFETEAVTVWVRFPAPHEGLAWRTGLIFPKTDPLQKRLLDSLERWFARGGSESCPPE